MYVGSAAAMPNRMSDKIMARTLTCGSALLPMYPHFGHLRTGGADVSLRPNSLKHLVQFVAQFDNRVEGHTLMPLGPQPLNHFRKPYSLRVTGGHVPTIVVPFRGHLLAERFSQWP